MVERANDGIIIIREGKVLFANRELTRMSGHPLSRLVGSPFLDYVHPSKREKIAERYRKRMAGKNVKSLYETVLLHRDGSAVPAEINTGRIRYEGEISDLVFIRDISARKKREKILRKERERFHTILDSMEDLVYITGPDFGVEYINPAMKKIFGPVKEKKCHDYLHEQEKRCPWCRQPEILKGETVRYEWTSPRNNRAYDVIETPLPNPSGAVSKLKIMRDITEIKKLETDLRRFNEKLEQTVIRRTAELNDANELLERIFSSVHFLIAYLDEDFNFLRVNRAYADAYDRNPGYFVGKNHFELFPDQENEKIFSRVADTGRPFVAYARPFIYPGRLDKGTTYWDWSLRPVKDEKGAVEGFILILVDVTEQKEAEEKLKRTRKKMADMARLAELGTLTSMVAHEIRSPLATIRLAIDNLSRKSDDPNLAPHIRSIGNKVEISNRIITSLLDYSHLELPRYKKFSILPLLRECLAETQKSRPEKKVRVKKDLESLQRKKVEADRDQIRQVIRNILENALDACPVDTGKIEISGHLDKNKTMILKFRDNGPGFSDEELKEAFTPFSTHKPSGTGLGLVICRDLVRLHDGTIEVKNAPQKGAIVTVKLPLRAQP